jgi:uncharacterized protein YidB (DUF937 family)
MLEFTQHQKWHREEEPRCSTTKGRAEAMGLLDGLIKQALGAGQGGGALGGLMDLVTKNPQILSAVGGLLSTRDTTIGGSGGLGGLISVFQKKGLGDMMSSWISTGPNPPISATQVKDVLGAETMGQFASKAGVPTGEAGSILAGLLPVIIDKLTPDGKLPDTNSLEGTLSSLLSKLG